MSGAPTGAGDQPRIVPDADLPPYTPPPTGVKVVIEAVGEGRPAMWCDVPDLNGGRIEGSELELRGWAISPEGIRSVLVTIDGERRLSALHGLPRTDLRWCFGDELAAECGFVLLLDEKELPPGPHELTVVAVAGDGSAQGVSGTVERVPAAKPSKVSPGDSIAPLRAPAPRLSGMPEDQLCAGYGWGTALVRGGRALDMGCGSGWGTALVGRSAAEAVGVDPSPALIAEAEERHGEPASFRRAPLDDLPFEDGEFDLVVALDSIEHLRDPERALDEARRVLRPGGLVLVSCPPHGDLPASLSRRFGNVAACRPQSYLATRLTADAAPAGDDFPAHVGAALPEGEAGEGDAYALALASDAELPTLPATVVVDAQLARDEQARLAELWRQRCLLAEVTMATHRTEAFYVAQAQRQTIARTAAQRHELERRAAALEHELVRAREERAQLLGSASWRLTRPLRAAKRVLRPGRPTR